MSSYAHCSCTNSEMTTVCLTQVLSSKFARHAFPYCNDVVVQASLSKGRSKGRQKEFEEVCAQHLKWVYVTLSKTPFEEYLLLPTYR